LPVTAKLAIALAEVEFSAIRAQGPGGQNVNKVSCAIHLRFNIAASSLPDEIKVRLLALSDQRISKEGVIVIKAQNSRSLEANKMEALRKLQQMVAGVAVLPTQRRATKPTRGSQLRRVDAKVKHGLTKALRRKALD
jgi:ribosome-associated protein